MTGWIWILRDGICANGLPDADMMEEYAGDETLWYLLMEYYELPGAIYECGCADIPEGDCDCNGNQLTKLGNVAETVYC